MIKALKLISLMLDELSDDPETRDLQILQIQLAINYMITLEEIKEHEEE